MLKVIISENKRRVFVKISDLDSLDLCLVDNLSDATFFSDNFDRELNLVLSKVRKTNEGYLFRVATLDDALVDAECILAQHIGRGIRCQL